ncbi:Uu.00g134960.m01.CDS01 [Anthostomella pinea]|uniref:Uu.00g134960.m01.CDS01 n=1 Tax=Anthostomella pinea TaxID=933095 RepID=A0AAI8VP10_9PEZI|nr:Uu.00g134960.m01.CDS01 [Anthostomella pinea]
MSRHPQDMSRRYPQSAGGMYAQPSLDGANYGHPAEPATYGQQQIYSFLPSQQHRRPRRRYQEIERMYNCCLNGCEKAYGTLNHLNAHVTMQSHGRRRTPDEFKEIREAWKARKKEEDQQQKAAEEAGWQRHAQAVASARTQF